MDNQQDIPSQQDIDAYSQEAFVQELAALVQLAQYRAEIAELDSAIDALLSDKIGAVTGSQAKALQAQKIAVPFGVPPTVFIGRRAALMMLTPAEMKRLFAPDLLDKDEMLILLWAMSDLVEWLTNLNQGVSPFIHVMQRYRAFLGDATRIYTAMQGHAPQVDRVLSLVMRLSLARKLQKQGE